MIKTGGANVSPAELEVQLRACAPVKLGPGRRRPRPAPRPARGGLHHAQGGRRGHRGGHPVVPPRAGGLLQGAQARPLLRRRRDPDDHQRHQGARRRPRRAGRPSGSPPNPCPRPPRETDDRATEPTTLDASDLDQYMGVPMEPGELKEPVVTNDIRRWVQGDALPEPAPLRRGVGGREPLRQHRGPAVVHRHLRHEPRLLARAGRDDPEQPPHLRRRRLVVLRPPRRGPATS